MTVERAGTGEDGAGRDSRLVYIVCHLMAWIYNAAALAALIWLALELRTGWVLLAMLAVGRGYKHDFGRGSGGGHETEPG